MKRLVLMLVTSALTCAPCLGQRQPRSSDALNAPGMLSETGALVYAAPEASLFATSAPAASFVVTNIDIPGGCSGWVEGRIYHYLCCGCLSGVVGVLQHWKWDAEGAAPPALLSTRLVPGQDIASVAYDPVGEFIYFHDAVSSELRSAAWDGVSPLPMNFQTILTSAEASELAAPGDFELRARESWGAGARTYVLMLEPYEPPGFPLVSSNLLPKKRINTSTVPATASPRITDLQDLGVSIVPGSLRDGQTVALLNVSFLSADTYEVYDADSLLLLGSATSPGGVNTLPVAVVAPFVVGRRYVPRRVGDALVPERAVECFVQYGADAITPLGLTIGAVRILPILEVGEHNYQVTIASHIKCSSAALADSQGMVPLAGYFLFDFRNPLTGQDPIGQYNGQTMLMTGNYFPATGLIDHVPGVGLMSVPSIPMPHLPELHGFVVLFQALYLEGGQFYASQIRGFSLIDS